MIEQKPGGVTISRTASGNRVDVLVVGGGLGGVAASIRAAELGQRVLLTEETDWLGGQLTSQGVPPDEHPWIEQFGCTAAYRALRDGIRDHYRRWYPLTDAARRDRVLNPGGGRVSGVCAEPRACVAVIDELLAPRRAEGLIEVLPYHRPLSAAVDGDDVDAVELLDLRTGERSWRTGTFVLDATETGLLLRLGGVEHRVGAESREETGEPHAAQTAEPHNQQALSMCFALDHLEGEDHTIDKPDSYARWREYEPSNWSGPLLSFIAPDPRSLAPVERTFTPNGSPPAGPADHRAGGGDLELWDFRRIIARDNFETGAFASDVTLVNWPMIDYFEGPIVGVHESESTRHLESARELSRSFLYWLQTEAPRSDGGAGWPGLRLRGDVFGTADGLAKTPYIRESRRIEAQLTVTELHVGVQASGQRGPVVFDDSVGVGCYRIDLHPSTGGDPYIDVAARPFTIPLRSLIPVRMRNLLPAAKNIGVTHVSNGCFRLHPTEFNVGEAAGALAAFCIMRRTEPAAVAETGALLGEFQNVLAASGVELGWPKVVAY